MRILGCICSVVTIHLWRAGEVGQPIILRGTEDGEGCRGGNVGGVQLLDNGPPRASLDAGKECVLHCLVVS
jgi:hypothetical protein